MKYHSSPSSRAQRFSVEAFKFIAAHPFVFVHCQVTVCNATNPGSKCSMKCPSSGREKRELSDNVTYDVYSLVQGPLHLTHEKRKENRGRILDKTGTSMSCFRGHILGMHPEDKFYPRPPVPHGSLLKAPQDFWAVKNISDNFPHSQKDSPFFVCIFFPRPNYKLIVTTS